jgi:hypothetical protein
MKTLLSPVVLSVVAGLLLGSCAGCDWLTPLCKRACPPPPPTVDSVIEDAAAVGIDWLRDRLASGGEQP